MRASGYERAAKDWYVEAPWVADLLLDHEAFPTGVWDPCCGAGNIPKRCALRGIDAIGSDIADRGFGAAGIDFFSEHPRTAVSIVANPPYNRLQAFVDHALVVTSGKVAVVAPMAFLAGQKRKTWYERGPLARVYVLSRRPSMPPGGSDIAAKGGTVDYAWLVWDRAHSGDPVIAGWLA